MNRQTIIANIEDAIDWIRPGTKITVSKTRNCHSQLVDLVIKLKEEERKAYVWEEQVHGMFKDIKKRLKTPLLISMSDSVKKAYPNGFPECEPMPRDTKAAEDLFPDSPYFQLKRNSCIHSLACGLSNSCMGCSDYETEKPKKRRKK
jgi:hypothetical protein